MHLHVPSIERMLLQRLGQLLHSDSGNMLRYSGDCAGNCSARGANFSSFVFSPNLSSGTFLLSQVAHLFIRGMWVHLSSRYEYWSLLELRMRASDNPLVRYFHITRLHHFLFFSYLHQVPTPAQVLGVVDAAEP